MRIPDQSGCVLSDHPVPGAGWIKGWLPAAGRRLLGIVCAHSNPSPAPPNNTVYCVARNGRKVVRNIVEVRRLSLFESKRNQNGDVALVKFDKAFPPACAVYQPGTVGKGKRIVNVDKRGTRNEFGLGKVDVRVPWLVAAGGTRQMKRFEPGDSGTPWFILDDDGKWKVASHTALGYWGEGPWYSHKLAWPVIERNIKEMLS